MKCRNILSLIALIYIIFSLFSIFILLQNWNKKSTKIDHLESKKVKVKNATRIRTVEIWGKAAVGLYFWEHILDGSLKNIQGELEKYGEINIDKITLKFRTGYLISPETVDKKTENAILVINGREQKKVDFAKKWLDSLKSFKYLKNLGIILLGNEYCENKWLMPYMASKGGIIRFANIIYDIPYVDRVTFYQWPLGVATYRNFPVVHSNMIRNGRRKYLCNFIGTIYKDSSREELIKTINVDAYLKKNCFIHARYEWVPHETEESSKIFVNALENSDFTLCPVGKNTECYRIYEAISLGSVPVIEDVMTPGSCGKSPFQNEDQIPLRMLKHFNAPVIYIKDWKELPSIIAKELTLTSTFISQRRKNLLNWYQKFKYQLRNKFLAQLKKHFDL